MKKNFTLLVLLSCMILPLAGQTGSLFQNVILKVDTLEFSYLKNTVSLDGERKIYFSYNDEDEVVQVDLVPFTGIRARGLRLLPSGDYDLIDSLLWVGPQLVRYKVRFHNLTKTDFLKFSFTVADSANSSRIVDVPLFPSTKTAIAFYPSNDEIYIGEEKVFELSASNLQNIPEIMEWKTSGVIDYRLTINSNQLMLHVLAKSLGRHTLKFTLKTKKPYIDSLGHISYELPPVNFSFLVLQSRLRFLNIDKKEVTLDEKAKMEGIEIQIDYEPGLEMGKTYRLENQEESGGPLITELFTKNLLANNKVLCILRPYNYHRSSEGYLYIKDGDRAKFITNLSITPKTSISKISVMHEGVDWNTNLNANPGEVIDVKVEGQSLYKANLVWEDVENLTSDTTLKTENFVMFKLKVPVNISKKRIELYNHGEPTGYALNVKEYQIARDFDFITLNYGAGDKVVSNVTGVLMYSKTIRDIVFDFDRNKIDTPEKLNGKQYLKIDIKITGKNNELIELQTIENVVIVPGEKSPRSQYYSRGDETATAISLNKYLRKKTYELEDWAKIEISVSDQKDKYNEQTFKKDIELYIQRDMTFDIDVSFPAGLLINTFGVADGQSSQYQNFGGISMAMIAQFSFYDQERPGKYKPYRIGAGFLALNTFNLTSDSNVERDMSIVILGSIYPTRRDLKLSFPLYLGGGYKLNQGKWFILLGPGIRVKL